jgi:hypothetical protein
MCYACKDHPGSRDRLNFSGPRQRDVNQRQKQDYRNTGYAGGDTSGGNKAAAVLWPVAALPLVQLKAIDMALEAIIATKATAVAGVTTRGFEETDGFMCTLESKVYTRHSKGK